MGVKVVSAMWFVNRYEPRYRSILQDAFAKDGYFDFELLVVSWHVATSVPELLTTSVVGSMQLNEQEDMQMSKLLSRYLMYLMVHKAELLPCHADIARQLVADAQRDLRQNTELSWDVEAITTLLEQGRVEEQNDSLPFNLRAGMRAARLLRTWILQSDGG
ncbi:hypothetical protein L7F22_057591 [Adiantum nelumboides]|nr:hypothetical protein [Adiantum nelumboides]